MISFVAKYPNAPLSTLLRLVVMDITLSDYQEIVNPYGWGIYEKKYDGKTPQIPQPSVLMTLRGIEGEYTIVQEWGLGYDHWMRPDHGEIRVFGYSKQKVEEWLNDPWSVVLSQSVYEMGHETLQDFDKNMKVTDLISLVDKTIIYNNELRSFGNCLFNKFEGALRSMDREGIVIRWYDEAEEEKKGEDPDFVPTAQEDKPSNVWFDMQTYNYLESCSNCNWDAFSMEYISECLIDDMNNNENRTHVFFNSIRQHLENKK